MSIGKFLKTAALSLTILGAGVAPAAAAAPQAGEATDSSITTSVSESVLRPDGFDAKIAAANGFKIVTGPDGSQRSVPVSDSARQWDAQYGSGAVSTQASAALTCGTGYVYVSRVGTTILTIRTGYNLNKPAVSRNWTVIGAARSGGIRANFSGVTSGFTFNQTKNLGVTNNSSGFVNVEGGVALANGTYCRAIGIRDTW